MLVSRKAQSTCRECGARLNPIGGPTKGAYVCCERCFVLYRYVRGKYPTPTTADELVRHLSVDAFIHLKEQRLKWLADQVIQALMDQAIPQRSSWSRLWQRVVEPSSS